MPSLESEPGSALNTDGYAIRGDIAGRIDPEHHRRACGMNRADWDAQERQQNRCNYYIVAIAVTIFHRRLILRSFVCLYNMSISIPSFKNWETMWVELAYKNWAICLLFVMQYAPRWGDGGDIGPGAGAVRCIFTPVEVIEIEHS